MPIRIDELRAASQRPEVKLAQTLAEARSKGLKSAFLCHSHADADLVKGMLNLLADSGWQVYVDWLDTAMPESPNRETANRIQQKIVDCNYFLFLATPNSVASRWCPWEIGCADGRKSVQQIIVIPTVDTSGKWYGNEYLHLYRKLDRASDGLLRVSEPGKADGTWVRWL